KPVVGRDTFGANLGSIYARVAGRNHPDTGLPTNIMLFPRAVDSSTQPGTMAFGRFHSTGNLGPAFAPFDPSAGSQAQADMRLNNPMDGLDDRRRLLAQLDQVRGRLAEERPLDAIARVREQALSTVLGGVADAFDLSKEDVRTIDRYNPAPLVRPESIDRR